MRLLVVAESGSLAASQIWHDGSFVVHGALRMRLYRLYATRRSMSWSLISNRIQRKASHSFANCGSREAIPHSLPLQGMTPMIGCARSVSGLTMQSHCPLI